MSKYSRYLIAATDITSRPKFMRPLRGKTAKEVYRFTKGAIVSKSLTGPFMYSASVIPRQISNGFVQKAISTAGEHIIGYFSFIGLARWTYIITDTTYIKNSARVVYNFACLPMTIYSKGISSAFDILYISKFEEYWFGTPVYIFNDNRLWIESNFTIEDAFRCVSDGGE